MDENDRQAMNGKLDGEGNHLMGERWTRKYQRSRFLRAKRMSIIKKWLRLASQRVGLRDMIV